MFTVLPVSSAVSISLIIFSPLRTAVLALFAANRLLRGEPQVWVWAYLAATLSVSAAARKVSATPHWPCRGSAPAVAPRSVINIILLPTAPAAAIAVQAALL